MATRTRFARLGAAGLWLLGTVGCGSSFDEREAEARLARLAADEARLDEAFDRLEARLLGNQGRIQLWRELERRHGEVSALQCQVSDAHLRGMVTHWERQREKLAEQSRRHMASANTALSATTETMNN